MKNLNAKIKEITEDVLSEIKPSDKEKKQVNNDITNVIMAVNKKLKGAKAILGGSGAKDTWIKGNYDADIFVMFNYKKFADKSDQLSELLLKQLGNTFKLARFHGSRDYFQIKKEDFTFELVPILEISKANQAKNITDVSPLHAKYVMKHSMFNDDIRLLKKFARAQNVYGAESHIKGFSGYAIEIIAIHYKGFSNALREISKWKDKIIIDPGHNYKNKQEIIRNLNQSKLRSPLVIIDPVDKSRNATAAVNEEKLNIMIIQARNFHKNPSKDFLVEKKFDIDDILKHKKVIAVKIKLVEDKPDIVGSKVIKIHDFIARKLEPFSIVKKGWNFDGRKTACVWFEYKNETISEEEIVGGPPLKLDKFVGEFKKKYKKTFNKGNKIYGYKKREFRNIKDALRSFLREDYIKEKVMETELLN